MFDELRLRPIGIIHSPFDERYRAPRQPGADPAAQAHTAEIHLHPGENYEQALSDLAGFEKIWLLYWFHRNSGWRPKVRPPRGGPTKRGVFATRSPHRPNPLGLTLATLIKIDGRTLWVRDIDILDGTPLLDIKPYLPYAEAFPQARTGWLPDPAEEAAARFAVQWSELAAAQRDWLQERFSIALAPDLERVLARTPFPHPYRRVTVLENGQLQAAVKSWRALFRVDGQTVTVLQLASGYEATALARGEPLHDDAAHRAFHQAWPAAPGC